MGRVHARQTLGYTFLSSPLPGFFGAPDVTTLKLKPRWSVFVGVLAACLGVALMAQTGPLEATGQIPYLATNSTSSAFTVATTSAGRVATAPSGLFSVGNSTKRYRGLELTPFGVGAANTTFDYRVWVIKRSTSSLAGVSDDYDRQLWCYGTVTLGTQAGVASRGITSGNNVGDTITVTASAYCAAAVAAYGATAPSYYSPADDTEARLFIPELGNAEYIWIDFDMTGATSGNFLVEKGI